LSCGASGFDPPKFTRRGQFCLPALIERSKKLEHFVGRGAASRLPCATAMNPPQGMDCPECSTQVPPMQGSTWAIAWYSCGKCGTFWYARLRVGPGSDALPATRMLAASAGRQANDVWSLEELEAEADALRRESDNLPKGNLEALRLHLEKLKVLADAINKRLDTVATSPASRGVNAASQRAIG